MNALLKIAERKFAVFGLLVFTGIFRFASYYHGSEGSGDTGGAYNPFDRIILLMEHGVYAATLLLIILRFKIFVRPAMRDPFLWGLVVMVVISWIWSDFPDISQKYGLRVLCTTLFGLYLASRFTMQEQLRIVAWALGIGAVVSFLYTLALPGAGIESGMHAGAWRGPLAHKNMFARLMTVSALPLFLVAMNKGKYRYLRWAVFGIAFALVVLSTSKTALVILLNLIVLAPLYGALRKSDNLVVPFLIICLLLGGSAATWVISDWNNVLTGLGKDPTLSGRTEIWEAVIDKIHERPWLGYGYHAFWQEGGGADWVARVVSYPVFQAHNGFVNLAAELGLLGASLFVLSIIFTYIRAIKWIFSGQTPEYIWPVIYVTFLPMYNYTETTTIEHNSLFWVLFVAISLSLKRLPVINPVPERENWTQQKFLEQV